MATGKITKRTVDATKPGSRDEYIWDTELAGFGLKVTPAGKRVYLVQYRIGGRRSRTRRVTIGAHGVFTPDQARGKAERILAEVALGRDPADVGTRLRTEPTISELADRYLASTSPITTNRAPPVRSHGSLLRGSSPLLVACE